MNDRIFWHVGKVSVEQSMVQPPEFFEKTKTIPCYGERHHECQASQPNGCECECHEEA